MTMARIVGCCLVALIIMATGVIQSHASSLVIVNAEVIHPVAVPSLRHGMILIEDGLIRRIARHVDIPADAEVIDARGHTITPGIFSAGSQLGLVEIYSVDDTNDGASARSGLHAAFDVHWGVNPDTSPMGVSRRAGLTRSAVFPRSTGSVFAGVGALVGMATTMPAALHTPHAFAYLDMADQGVRNAGGGRGAVWPRLEQMFRLHASDVSEQSVLADPLDEATVVKALATGRLLMLMRVQSTRDILLALGFMDRHPRVRLVLVGAAEGWRVAGEIARRKVPVILDAYANIPTRFELIASTRENARRLAEAGVVIALIPGEPDEPMATANARSILHAAGVAVAHGLAWEQALEAVTLNPARIFGVEGELGSLEPGKRADLVIWDGDPFELSTRPVMVLVDGRVQPLVSRQDLLLERYRAVPPR